MGLFKKLFGTKKNQEANSDNTPIEKQSNGLDRPIEEIKRENEGYVSIGRSIFPVIKDANDHRIKMSLNNPGSEIVHIPIADGIVKCYVLDLGDRFEMISESHLKQFAIDREMLDNTAIRNLKNKFNERNGVSTQDFTQ